VPALIVILTYKSENEHVRKEATKALKKINTPEAQKALKDEDENVRMQAARALGYIVPDAKEAVPYLIEVLKDTDEEVRRSAAEALKNINTSEAKNALKDKSEFVHALENIVHDAKAVVPTLIEALKDEDKEVHKNAAKALKKINTPEAQKALKDYER